MRSGNVQIDVGRVKNIGYAGLWWSTMAHAYNSTTNAMAFFMGVYVVDVGSSRDGNRWGGNSLRWLGNDVIVVLQ